MMSSLQQTFGVIILFLDVFLVGWIAGFLTLMVLLALDEMKEEMKNAGDGKGLSLDRGAGQRGNEATVR